MAVNTKPVNLKAEMLALGITTCDGLLAALRNMGIDADSAAPGWVAPHFGFISVRRAAQLILKIEKW